MMNGGDTPQSMPWLQKQPVNAQSAAPVGGMRARLQQAGDMQLGQMSKQLGMPPTTQQWSERDAPAYQQEFAAGQQGGYVPGLVCSKGMAPPMYFQPAAIEREQMPPRNRGNFCPPVQQASPVGATPFMPWVTDQIKRKPAAPKVPAPAADECIRDMPLPKFLFASAPTSPGSSSPAELTPRSISPPPGLPQPPGRMLNGGASKDKSEEDWIFIAMGDEEASTEGPLSEDELTVHEQAYNQWSRPDQGYGKMKYEFDPTNMQVQMTMSF